MSILGIVFFVVIGAVVVVVFPKAFAFVKKQVTSVKNDAPAVITKVEDLTKK